MLRKFHHVSRDISREVSVRMPKPPCFREHYFQLGVWLCVLSVRRVFASILTQNRDVIADTSVQRMCPIDDIA